MEVPNLSVQVASRLLEMLNEYNVRRRQSQAGAEREFVAVQLAQAQADLTAAEDLLATFYRNNRRFADSPELAAEEARLQRRVNLRQQLHLALSQSYESAKIEEIRNTPVLTVIERPEGFIQRVPRGTVRKAGLAFVLAFLLAVGIAFAREQVSTALEDGSDEFKESLALVKEILAPLRGGLLRRRDRSERKVESAAAAARHEGSDR